MTTSFAQLSLADIKPHPKNVRHDAVADDELIDSVRTSGLVQPLVVAPDTTGTGYWLIAGHRRKNALEAAGITTAPAVIRADLLTEAQQIEAMLIENGRRKDLTAVEEAEGYEQLELFGYKPKDIAKATGRSEKTVRERLKLRDLPEKTRGKLHDGQVSIADALTLLEFEDDHETFARLEQSLGTHNYQWQVENARRDRERAVRYAAQVTELTDAGVPRVDDSTPNNAGTGPWPIAWMHAFAQESDHDGCLAWRGNRVVQLLCTDPGKHKQAEPATDPAQAERQAQIEKDRQEFEARRDAEASARSVRATHIRSTVRDFPTGKTITGLIRVVLPRLVEAAWNEGHASAFLQVLGFDADADHAQVRHELSLRSDNTVGQVLVAFLASIAEYQIEDIYDEETAGDTQRYLEWLTDIGHTFCDIDTALADTVAEHLGDVEDEEDAS